MADARDLKSCDTQVSYRFEPGFRHQFSFNIIYRGVEQLVARRAHNPEVVRFKSHPRNQVPVPKKMHRRKPEVSSGFLYFSRVFSIFQKSNNIAVKKMQTSVFDRREGSEPKNRHFRGIFDDIFSSDIPLFCFYNC